MRIRTAAGRCIALIALAAGPAFATTYIVDDSSTIPFESQVVTRWRNTTGAYRQLGSEIEGGATVSIRLNLQPWLNRNGRVYLALPQQPVGVVNVEWATQGRLLPGKLQSGERTLVYAGPIRSGFIEDNFTVQRRRRRPPGRGRAAPAIPFRNRRRLIPMRKLHSLPLAFAAMIAAVACVPAPASGQGFATMVSPPRFELDGKAGQTQRQVIEITNADNSRRSTACVPPTGRSTRMPWCG